MNKFGLFKKKMYLCGHKRNIRNNIEFTQKILKNNMKDIECCKFADLNLGDSFFDSLKASYPEFEDWFHRKAVAGETAYVYIGDDGLIKDFLYLKIETEEVSDVQPILPAKKRLKVGTFKLLPRHTRRGERFMKKIMDCAIAENVDEIYVTIFPKPELEYLIQSFERYGFEHIADKDHGSRGKEYVLVKDMRTWKEDIVKDYPFVQMEDVRKWLLAIYPKYHTKLFPDSILKTENPYDVVKDITPTNSIYKIYICWMEGVANLKHGDLVLIYRTSDGLGPAAYRSVVSSVCTVNEVKTIKDFASEDEFVKYNQYSVFGESELREWYRRYPDFYVIKMLYNVAFTQKVIRKVLIEDVGVNKDVRWGFMPISDKQFNTIIKLGGANERYFIH